MAKLPYMQFYPADWIQDTQTLTLQAQGAWITVLCQLWVSDTPGVKTWNRREFTTLLRLSYDEEVEQIVADLSRVAEVSLADKGGNEVELFENCVWITIKSRRIVRDREAISSRNTSHKRYNDKRTTRKRHANDTETTHRIQKSESEVRIQKSESEEEKKEERKKKSCGQVKTLPAVPKSAETWQAYSEAYQGRYGVEPVRNQKTNALLCTLVERLGSSDAPAVAAFYLTHNGPMYVRCRHPPNLLVQDAEGLWTQWKTGQKATTSEVRQAELKDDSREQVKRVEAMLARGL